MFSRMMTVQITTDQNYNAPSAEFFGQFLASPKLYITLSTDVKIIDISCNSRRRLSVSRHPLQ